MKYVLVLAVYAGSWFDLLFNFLCETRTKSVCYASCRSY